MYKIDFLGGFRFILASIVVLGHTSSVAGDAHRYAVMGFFCISGYLITRIRAEIHPYRASKFLTNRFLRIYPQYIIAVILGFIVILLLPQEALRFFSWMTMPSTIYEWGAQIFLLGSFEQHANVLPQTWSLRVEIYYYLIIGLLTWRSEKVTYAILGLSVVVCGLSLLGLIPILFRSGFFSTGVYFSIIGNAVVFYMGSAAYFASRRFMVPIWLPWTMLIVFLALAGGFLLPMAAPNVVRRAHLVIGGLLIAVSLINFPEINTRHQRVADLSVFLGRLSYPLFLVHPVCCVVVIGLLGRVNPWFFLNGFALSLIVSIGMVVTIDRPIERLRARIRHESAGGKV